MDALQSSASFVAPYAYDELRGVIRALGFGGSDAFRDGQDSLELTYVDGISLTVGSPRRHVYTLAHGLADSFTSGLGDAECPCAGGLGAPAFVGAAYLCEGTTTSLDDVFNRTLDESDVLFDGAAINDETCLAATESASSFEVAVELTADDLEVRLMSSDPTANEDTLLAFAELWVR